MPFSETFGGQNIYPSQLTLLRLAMTADVTLQWPVEQAIAGADVFAEIIHASSDAARTITLPDATRAGPGQATLVNNVGAFTITVEDADGNTVGAVPSGEAWQFYLNLNTTTAGTWVTFQFGTGVSSATAAALAGAGLVAITTLLNVRMVPEEVGPATPYVVVNADRAKAKIWTGGLGDFSLPDPATLGSSWMMYVRNSGSGNLTLTTAAGYINTAGELDYTLPVGGSALFVSAGTYWFTLSDGLGTAGDFNFLAISVAGAAGNYVLAGNELNKITYRFTGALTGNRNVVVPNAVQQYWVSNQTSGAFTLTVKTLLGTGVVVPQGYAAILSSDGINVVAWEGDPTSGVTSPAQGGTGLSTYAQGDLIYATAAAVLARLAKSATATRYLSNRGASNAPQWDRVLLTNGVEGQLPHANIADLSGTSVFGRAANSAGVGGSIAGTNNQVMRVNSAGTLLEFGQLNLAAAAAVTGALGTDHGGTGLIAYAQGDIIYASAANTLAALAKHTTFKRPLMNTGVNNAPQWGALEIFVQTPLAGSYTLNVANCSWVYQYESAGATTVEVPANATEAFPVGTIIPFGNDAAAGNMTFTPLGAATFSAQGESYTVGENFVLPPGYSAILWKVATDSWMLMTDSPKPTDVIYSGYIGADGATGNSLPAGWSVAHPATGRYVVTHNLGLPSATALSVSPAAISDVSRYAHIADTNLGVNTFEIRVEAGDGSTLQDEPNFFTAKRNA